MRTAIIDLGTNTFNLLIVEGQEILFRQKIAVKLGEGGITKGFIAKAAFERGVGALKEHLQTINNYKVTQTLAFATSAIRSASNGAAFVEQAKEQLNLAIQVIDGDREAKLIYLGVRQALNLGEQYNLIMDIGGGSTEFIICNSNKIFWKKSFQLGAARLLERFQPQEPISTQNIIELESYLESELQALWKSLDKYPCNTLVGSSGSFDTLAEVIAHQFYNASILKEETTYNFKMEDYYWLHDYLLKANLKERLETPGITPIRADMIVISTVFINYLLKRQKIDCMKLSTYALKEGVLSTLRR